MTPELQKSVDQLKQYQGNALVNKFGANTQVPQASSPANPFGTNTPGITKPAQVIDAATLNNQSYTFPEVKQTPTYDISSIPTTIEGAQQAADASLAARQPTATEQAQVQGQNRLLGLMDKLMGKTQAQQTAEATFKVPEFQQQLTDINSQIQTLQKDSAAQQIRSEDRFAPTFAIQGEQAQIQHEASIKALGLSAVAQTLQGNLALAQQQADMAVELEFEPIQQQIDYTKQWLQLNQDNLNREDKKRADALQLQLQERQRLLDEQKLDKQQISTTAMEAAKSGASSSVVNSILASKSINQAISLAASSLGTAFAQDLKTKTLQNQLLQAQISKIYADISPSNQATTATADNLTQVLGNSKISGTTKTGIGTIMGVLNAAETMAKNNPSGVFGGISPVNAVLPGWLPFREALKSTAGVNNSGYIDGINLKIQQWASGASLTKQQTEQVARLTPSRNDTDQKVREKLNNLSNFMQDQIKGMLAAEGINYTPQTIDLFKPEQSLVDIFAGTLPTSTKMK